MTPRTCKTQWHIIVAYLWQQKDWLPTHSLQSTRIDFAFIGSSGEQRVRELARNDNCIPDELRYKTETKRGSEIGLDPPYEYLTPDYQQSKCSEAAKLDRFWLEFSVVIPRLGGAEAMKASSFWMPRRHSYSSRVPMACR